MILNIIHYANIAVISPNSGSPTPTVTAMHPHLVTGWRMVRTRNSELIGLLVFMG